MAEMRIFLSRAAAANSSANGRQFWTCGPAPLVSNRFQAMEPNPWARAQSSRATFASVRKPMRIPTQLFLYDFVALVLEQLHDSLFADQVRSPYDHNCIFVPVQKLFDLRHPAPIAVRDQPLVDGWGLSHGFVQHFVQAG